MDPQSISYLVRMAPSVTICVGGLLCAGLLHRRCSRVAPLVMIALVAKLAIAITGFMVMRWMISALQSGVPGATIGYRSGLISSIAGLIDASVLGLLVTAVFIGRPGIAKPPALEDSPLPMQ